MPRDAIRKLLEFSGEATETLERLANGSSVERMLVASSPWAVNFLDITTVRRLSRDGEDIVRTEIERNQTAQNILNVKDFVRLQVCP